MTGDDAAFDIGRATGAEVDEKNNRLALIKGLFRRLDCRRYEHREQREQGKTIYDPFHLATSFRSTPGQFHKRFVLKTLIYILAPARHRAL
jgi:hypothetical protein